MSREGVWSIRDNRSLSWSAKYVWLMLESRGDDCRPSMATIAADCGISRSTVIRAIAELDDAGWLKVVPTVNDNRTSACNSYRPIAPGCGADSFTQTPQGVTQTPQGVRETHKEENNYTPTDVLRTSVVPTPSGDAEIHRLDVERVCIHLAERIEGHGSRRPTITKVWRDSARLLIDKDGRTEDQIHRAIDWCQDNDFWHTNILSMPTLRKQYDKLRLQAQRDQQMAQRRRQAEEEELHPRGQYRADDYRGGPRASSVASPAVSAEDWEDSADVY